jgi:hypothetical protein
MQDAFCLLRGDLKRLFIGRFFTGVKVDSVMVASACDAFGTMFVLYETSKKVQFKAVHHSWLATLLTRVALTPLSIRGPGVRRE